jgi:adenosine deaminase
MPLHPLDDVTLTPELATLPKADLHLHQEELARLERVVARQQGRPLFDWRPSVQRLLDEVPPGMRRLAEMYAADATLDLGDAAPEAPEHVVAKIEDVLDEGAADGAVLIEVRFGATSIAYTQPEFMALFREAERRVQRRYPRLVAEALCFLPVSPDPARLEAGERHLERCIERAREGLAGLDLLVSPYDSEADPATWAIAYEWAQRAVDAGLGITIHVGEFAPDNLLAALRTPGLGRLGHAVYATATPALLDAVVRSGVTVECSLSCNVILGAAPSFEEHPIGRLAQAGVPVTLNTDNPVRVATTIGREYAIASALGFSHCELAGFTRNAVRASFTSEPRRRTLLAALDEWEAAYGA